MQSIMCRTGLNEAELDLVLRCYNGIELHKPFVPERHVAGILYGTEILYSDISGETSNAHQESVEYSTWLETFSGNPEEPFILNDILEKISNLSDD